MTLPGLLIEYLITGATSVIWIWLILSAIAPEYTLSVKELTAAHLTFGAPLTYVLGMVIDYLGRVIATFCRSQPIAVKLCD